MKLNLGSGSDIKKGYLNIDVRRLFGVDLVSKVEDLYFMKDSVEEVFMKDTLEHIAIDDCEEVLSRIHEWLVPNGLLFIQAPDFDLIMKRYRRYGLDDVSIRYIYGGQDYEGNFHKNGFNRARITEILNKVGFRVERYINEGLNFKLWARKEVWSR